MRAIVLERGPKAPVMAAAARLGVSHAALLQRAGSKKRLMLRAFTPTVPAVLEELSAEPPVSGRARVLTALLSELNAFHDQMLPGLMALKAAGVRAKPSGASAPTVALRRALAAWLRRAGLPTSRAAAVAEGLLGAIEARSFNAYLGGPSFVEGRDEHFVSGLVRHLVPELAATGSRERSA